MDLEILLLLVLVPVLSGQQQGPMTYEVDVTYHSYSNPSRRCVDCGGGTVPGCCEVSTSVPLNQTCPVADTCDIAATHCLRPFGSTLDCSRAENGATLLPTAFLNVHSGLTFNQNYFGVPNPLTYNSTERWQGIQILHIFHECTHTTSCLVNYDTVIDRVPLNIQTVVGIPTTATTYYGIAGLVNLTATVLVRCSDSYYGPDCYTPCPNFVSCTGCGLARFTGQYCQFLVDNCSSVYCNSRGSCREGSPNCACNHGYGGSTCATDLNFCNTTTCLNGGTCVEGIGNATTCTCPAGFTGSRCEVDLDFCFNRTCLNGGICMEGLGTITTCSCQLGFNGTTCEMDLDFCMPTSCRNNGTCQEEYGLLTSCDCPAGYSGAVCEQDLDYCTNTTCLNGGSCFEGPGTATGCGCKPGFSGSICENDLDFCTPDTCQNGGTCVEGIGTAVTCSCVTGYSGGRCQVDDNFCTSTRCRNGGTCIEGVGTITNCSCAPGFSGNSCEDDLDGFCFPTTCMNGGTCREGLGASTVCFCAPGFSGTNCETDLNFCTSSTCSNGGTCSEGRGRETSCSCPAEYTGPTCLSLIELPPTPCPPDMNSEWMLSYVETMPGEVISHPCNSVPSTGGSTVEGMITRMCLGDGVWGAVDVSGCREREFVELTVEAQLTFGGAMVEGNRVETVLENLQAATNVDSPDDASEFPRDLETANNILDMSVAFLTNELTLNPNDPLALSTRVVEVINNVLEPNNAPGWQSFSENEAGSEQLLNNAESYGQYFAQALMNPNVDIGDEINQTMAITRRNIVIQAQFVDPRNVDDILYPPKIDIRKLSEFGSAQSILPASFLIQRGAREVTISAVNILMDNLRAYLPRDSLNSSTQPVTSVISTQLIIPMNSTDSNSTINGKDATETPTATTEAYRAEPAAFRFTTKELEMGKVGKNPKCAFWNFGDGVKESAWSTEGVTTEFVMQDPDRKTYDVVCRSTHLTSFAVLLDVNNALTDVESEVLTYISYIGCSISIVCLLATIVFFITITWKKLYDKVHYFIHLNLSIALLLGYVVFLAGLDTAVGNRIGCAFVAALLHYLFTAAFCWMLCEGIMLFLKLVVVFSKISQKWWFFFIIGWVPPLVIVAVSVGIIHSQYGTENYCWISVEDPKSGAIWAFALPMLVIILINFGIMVLVLYKLYRLKKNKLINAKKYQKGRGERGLIKDLIIAAVFLNPLLGGTWVFGLLSVSRETTFFAWIFTVLNSLQGLFIFIFYVIKSEEVWGKLCGKNRTDSTRMTTLSRRSRASVSEQGGRRLSHQYSSSSFIEDQGMKGRRLSSQYISTFKASTMKTVKEDKEQLIDIDTDMFSTSQ